MKTKFNSESTHRLTQAKLLPASLALAGALTLQYQASARWHADRGHGASGSKIEQLLQLSPKTALTIIFGSAACLQIRGRSQPQ